MSEPQIYRDIIIIGSGGGHPMRDTVRRVAAQHKLFEGELMGDSRYRPIVFARQQAMWEIRQIKGQYAAQRFSFLRIAAFFKKDHSTVIHGCRQYEARMAHARQLEALRTGRKVA